MEFNTEMGQWFDYKLSNGSLYNIFAISVLQASE